MTGGMIMGEHKIIGMIQQLQDTEIYKDLHWEGTFEDYRSIVQENPRVVKN